MNESPFETFGSYDSHQPVLITALTQTKGDVLELGCGHGSTPLLHYLCQIFKRKLVSLDHNPEWAEQFASYRNDNHIIEVVSDYTMWEWKTEWLHKKYGLSFVDQAPGEARVDSILKLKDNADLIVCHDSEASGYNYEPAFAQFKYRFDYKELRPWTTVLSDTINFAM